MTKVRYPVDPTGRALAFRRTVEELAAVHDASAVADMLERGRCILWRHVPAGVNRVARWDAQSRLSCLGHLADEGPVARRGWHLMLAGQRDVGRTKVVVPY